MRNIILILLLAPLVVVCGCSKSVPEASVSISIVAHSVADNTITFRLWNNLKEPIVIQTDESNDTPTYQLQFEKGELKELGNLKGQTPLLKNVSVQPGASLDFTHSLGPQRPVKFRASVSYHRENNQSDKTLIWSEWFSAL